MESFLLIISFLLHLITLTALFQLLKKIQSMEKANVSNELVSVMEHSIEEMKEENKRLQLILDKQENDFVKKPEKKPENQKQQKVTEKDIEEEAYDEVLEKLLTKKPSYQVEASLESKIMQLYKQGHTIEDIAKKLDCGKTEAELVIKLYDK